MHSSFYFTFTISMKQFLIFLLSLCFLGGCVSQPSVGEGCTPQLSIHKIHIPPTTSTSLLCLGEEISGIGTNLKDTLTVFIKQAQIPDYNTSIQYVSSASCEKDKKEAQRLENGDINPQGRPSTIYPQRDCSEREYKPYYFSPVSIYNFTGSVDEVIAYFQEQDGVKYSPVLELKKSPGYRDEKWGSFGMFGKNIIRKLSEGTVKLYEWRGASTNFSPTYISERYVLYNATTPNWIYKIAVRDEQSIAYPDNSVIDFIQ